MQGPCATTAGRLYSDCLRLSVSAAGEISIPGVISNETSLESMTRDPEKDGTALLVRSDKSLKFQATALHRNQDRKA